MKESIISVLIIICVQLTSCALSLSKFSPSRVAPSSTQTTGKIAWSIHSIRNQSKGSDWLSMEVELGVQVL